VAAEARPIAPLIEQAAERLSEAGNLLLTCHLGPDGDSIGSMIVNERNQRFYRPAPGRSCMLGVRAKFEF